MMQRVLPALSLENWLCCALLALNLGRTFRMAGRMSRMIKRRHYAPPLVSVAEHIFSWRFALFLGGDANFRVVRRNVSSEIRDPSLVDGGAYFVQNSHYIAHLKENSDLPQEVKFDIFINFDIG